MIGCGFGDLEAVAFAFAEDEGEEGGEHDGGDDGLRPKAVDAPLFDDVGLEIGEEAGSAKAYFSELEERPPPAEEGEQQHDGIGSDAGGGDGEVELFAVGRFVEGAGREDGETGMINGAAIPFFGDGAGRRGAGIHVVDAQGEDADDQAGEAKGCNDKAHDDVPHRSILDFRSHGLVMMKR